MSSTVLPEMTTPLGETGPAPREGSSALDVPRRPHDVRSFAQAQRSDVPHVPSGFQSESSIARLVPRPSHAQR